MKRRALLASALAAALAPRVKAADVAGLESAELELTEFSLPGDEKFGRALLAVPRRAPDQPELLVLLHGLGETKQQALGARAFAERYGLLSAVRRLTHPPLARTEPVSDYFGKGRLLEVNARLERRAFRCPILVCPYTPNPYQPGGNEVRERFARFVTGPLKIAVEQRAGVTFPPARCMISGVSLGGYLAIEIFLKYPEAFCALGTAQGAFGPNQAGRYAAAVAAATQRVGRRRIEILTSSADPYRATNEQLHRKLLQLKQAASLRVSPGPHDQRWLKESGVIDMLLAADDVFAEGRAEAE